MNFVLGRQIRVSRVRVRVEGADRVRVRVEAAFLDLVKWMNMLCYIYAHMREEDSRHLYLFGLGYYVGRNSTAVLQCCPN